MKKSNVKKLQTKVTSYYDKSIQKLLDNDPRDDVNYMISKIKVDYRLLNLIDFSNKKILNIGCSFPIDEIYFARKVKQWVAIELSSETVNIGKKIIKTELSANLAKKIKIVKADAASIPYPDNTFDIVVAFSTIDHIPGYEKRMKVFKEINRVTKSGGNIIITVPNKLNLLFYFHSMAKEKKGIGYEYLHCFTPCELRKIGKSLNWEILSFASTLTIPIPNLSTFSKLSRIIILTGKFILSPIELFGRRMGYLFKKSS